MAEVNVMGLSQVLSIIAPGGNTPLVLACEVDHNFDRSRAEINADNKCGKNRIPNPNMDASISGTGQVMINPAGGDITTKISEAKLDQLMRSATVFSWVLGPKSGVPAPGDVTYSGQGWFNQLNTAYTTDGVATFDFSITVSGDYTQEIEPAA